MTAISQSRISTATDGGVSSSFARDIYRRSPVAGNLPLLTTEKIKCQSYDKTAEFHGDGDVQFPARNGREEREPETQLLLFYSLGKYIKTHLNIIFVNVLGTYYSQD